MPGQSLVQRIAGQIGLYGAIACYVVFALLPIYWTIKISVTPQDLLYSEGIRLWPSRMTLDNYTSVLKASDFPRYFLNSILVSVTTAIIVTAVASFAGYALSRSKFRGKAMVSLVLLLTQTFPLVMVIPPIYRIMGQLGLTDNLYGLIIIYTAFNIAFATFLMQSFLDGVPKDLEEAAARAVPIPQGCRSRRRGRELAGVLRRLVFGAHADLQGLLSAPRPAAVLPGPAG